MSRSSVLQFVRELAGDAAVYLLGSVAVGAAGVVLIPLYTRFLPPAAFGVYALLEAVIQVAVVICTLGANVGYLKWFTDLPTERRIRLFSATLVLAGGIAIVGGCAIAFSGMTEAATLLGISPARSFWTLGPLVLTGVVSNVLLTELRCQRRTVLYSVASVLRLLATVGASIYTVAIIRGGVSGVLYGRMAGELVGIVFLGAATFSSFGRPGEWRELKQMLRYGMPIVVSSLSITVLATLGRYLLTWFGTLDQVGIYAAATKVAGVVALLLVQPFGIAWGGLMFRIGKESDGPRIYGLILAATWAVGWGVIAAFGLMTPELFGVLTSSAYHSAERVFPWLLVTQLMTLMQYPVGVGLYLTQRTNALSLVYLGGLALNIGIGTPLVLWAGTAGAAAAWFIANAAITAATWILAQRAYPIPWRPAWFGSVGVVGIAVLTLATVVPSRPWGPGGLVRLLLGLLACGAAAWIASRVLETALVPGGEADSTSGTKATPHVEPSA